MTSLGDSVLFLVPSLSLLSQALREWSTDTDSPLRNFVVCSDSKVGREEEDIWLHDLALPATTNPNELARRLKTPFQKGTERRNVVFSTYHSLDVIAQAQKKGAPAFDLVICDERIAPPALARPTKKKKVISRRYITPLIFAPKNAYT